VNINEITSEIIGSAINVHRELGPGLFESAYSACFTFELTKRGISFVKEQPVQLVYQGVTLHCGYRIDLIVENRVVVELKSIARFEEIHTSQMITYLKLSKCQVGLLINFNVPVLVKGIRRVVLGLPETSASSAPLR
jgi:GxxExxY protein